MNHKSQMPVDIFANDDGYLIVADLPGVKSDDLKIELDKGMLYVSGVRKLNWNNEAAEGNTIEYRRRFQVPDEIDGAKVDAKLTDGVLTITLPKGEAHKPRRIAIG